MEPEDSSTKEDPPASPPAGSFMTVNLDLGETDLKDGDDNKKDRINDNNDDKDTPSQLDHHHHPPKEDAPATHAPNTEHPAAKEEDMTESNVQDEDPTEINLKENEEEDDKENEQGNGAAAEEEDKSQSNPVLGGRCDKKAFCLLDGICDGKDGVRSRVTIPLTRLPAVLGRSHTTGDINFFSLGPAKALSRQHCVIDYREAGGGKLVTPKSAGKDSPEEDTLEFERGKPFQLVNSDTNTDPAVKQDPDSKQNTTNRYPPRGAFVLQALGKNVIMVGNQRIRQGEVALLSSGVPIRMSTYSLYFLLPTDTSDPPTTMEIPIEKTPPAETAKKVTTKRKTPSSSNSSPPQPKIKKPKAAPFAQLQAELDALPIETLLERMNEAVDSDRWERKYQLIGATIALHAVNDATAAPEIRALAADGGVARTEIMRWIRESPKFSEWVSQMMSKMEAKSYQNTITKALLKAGNIRTGSGGRYIKWILPGVTLNPASEEGEGARAKVKQEPGDEEGEEEDDNEEEGNEEQEEEEGGGDEDSDGGDEDENNDDQEGEGIVEETNEDRGEET